MLLPPGPPGTTSCSADVEVSDVLLCASSDPDRKQVGALAAVGGPAVTRVSCCAMSSLMARRAPAAQVAAAHEQTQGGQVLLCLIG